MSYKTEPHLRETKKGNCRDCSGTGSVGMYQEACNYCDGSGQIDPPPPITNNKK